METELFNLLFEAISALGFDVYPYLPREEEGYPFVNLGEVEVLPQMTKSFSVGEASAVIHVRTDGRDRRACSNMIEQILEVIRQFEKPHLWFLKERSIRIMADDSTNDTLRHRVISLTYKFY